MVCSQLARGGQSIRAVDTRMGWLRDVTCVAQEGAEPALPKWPWVHPLAPAIPGSTWTPLPCTAQGPFWPYQSPTPTKFSLAKLKCLCFLLVQARFEFSTPSPLQFFKLCSNKNKTSQTFPCLSFHWS